MAANNFDSVKDLNVQRVVFKNGENTKSSEPRAVTPKEFYWDDIIIILVSAILGLTLLDIVAEFFRGAGVRCFSPSTSGMNESEDFTRAQADFVDSFCYQSLPPSEYYSIFILAHGLGLVAPHYLWKALFGGYFDFFFELVKGLKRLRSSKTGEYDEMNFEIVRKLQKEYGKSMKIFGLYVVKLSLQLGIAVFTLLMGTVYFNDFSPNFTCPDNSSRPYWPLEMTNITCVYTSLRFLSVVRLVDMVFVGLTIPFILYGLGWCFIAHTRELGHAKIARFIADSCFLAEHYQPKYVHSIFSSQFRIVSDLTFLLMRLFRTDAGHGQVFREIQIEEEFMRLNKQDSEWLQHVLDNSADKKQSSYKEVNTWKEKGSTAASTDNIYRRFVSGDIPITVIGPPTEQKNFPRPHPVHRPVLMEESVTSDQLSNEICYFSIEKKEFKHRLHQMHSLIVDAKDMIDVTAMDVSFGSTGSAHILPWMCTTVLSVNFDPHKKDRDIESLQEMTHYDSNVTAFHLPADTFVRHADKVTKFKGELEKFFGKQDPVTRVPEYGLDLIVVAPMEDREKEVTVDLLLDKLHCKDNPGFIHHKAVLLTVRPLEIDGRVTIAKFIDYIPDPSHFTPVGSDKVKVTERIGEYNFKRVKSAPSSGKVNSSPGITVSPAVPGMREGEINEEGFEEGIITFCGGVSTVIKFSLYQYMVENEGKGATQQQHESAV